MSNILEFTSFQATNVDSVPDGEWGWLIVVTAFMINFLISGLLYSCTVFYEQFLIYYFKDETITSLCFSLMNGMVMFVGPLSNALTRIYGCRFVSITGGMITFLGLLWSVLFDYNIYCQCVTLGIICGIGLGFMFFPQIIILNEWFTNHLNMAVDIAVCGSGFGIATFAYLLSIWINKFNWKDSMIILSLIMFLNIILPILFVYPKSRSNIQRSNERLLRCSFRNQMRILKTVLGETFNLEDINNEIFIYFIVANFLNNLAFFIPILVISDHVNRLNIGTTKEGLELIIYFGLSNALLRPFCQMISNLENINRIGIYGSSILIISLITSLINLIGYDLFNLRILYIMFGATEAFYSCFFSLVLLDLSNNKTNILNLLEINLLFNGIASIIGPPIIIFFGRYGVGYSIAIWISSLLMFISGIMIININNFQDISDEIFGFIYNTDSIAENVEEVHSYEVDGIANDLEYNYGGNDHEFSFVNVIVEDSETTSDDNNSSDDDYNYGPYLIIS